MDQQGDPGGRLACRVLGPLVPFACLASGRCESACTGCIHEDAVTTHRVACGTAHAGRVSACAPRTCERRCEGVPCSDVPPVVAPDGDDCVVGGGGALERCHQTAKLCVDEPGADFQRTLSAGAMGATRTENELHGGFKVHVRDCRIVVLSEQPDKRVWKCAVRDRWEKRGERRVGWEIDGVEWVEVQVLPWELEWNVWLVIPGVGPMRRVIGERC